MVSKGACEAAVWSKKPVLLATLTCVVCHVIRGTVKDHNAEWCAQVWHAQIPAAANSSRCTQWMGLLGWCNAIKKYLTTNELTERNLVPLETVADLFVKMWSFPKSCKLSLIWVGVILRSTPFKSLGFRHDFRWKVRPGSPLWSHYFFWTFHWYSCWRSNLCWPFLTAFSYHGPSCLEIQMLGLRRLLFR